MNVMFDLNIVLDVVQQREPHYRMSAAALSTVVKYRGQVAFIIILFTTAFMLRVSTCPLFS